MPPKTISLKSSIYPPFEDVRRVSADDALFDLCELTIGGWHGRCVRRKFANSVSSLSLSTVTTSTGGKTKLFERRDAAVDWNSPTLKVLGTGNGEGIRYPHPTFSGFLNARATGTNQIRWKALFHVKLNVNRAIQAQMIDLDRRRVTVHRSGPYALAITREARAEIRERLLAPATNMLSHTEDRLAFAQTQCAEQHLSEKIENIFEFVRQGMSDAIPSTTDRSDVAQRPTVTMRTIEVCWDFYEEEPIICVDLIKHKAQSITQSARVRYWPAFDFEERLRYDSPSVMIHLKAGLAIRWYAKAETTLRFEVIYGREMIKKFQPSAGILSLENTELTNRAIREDAPTHLNQLLNLMRDDWVWSEYEATTDELIRAVQAEVTDVIEARSLLIRLCRFGRIAPYPKDPNYPILRRLKKVGVLENEQSSQGRRNYVLSPRYRYAGRQLQTHRLIRRRHLLKRRPPHIKDREEWT